MLHEIAMSLGLTLADPGTVIPVLLKQLGASNTIIGLLPSIRFGGWFLPQLVAAGYLQSKPRKVPYVVGLDLARSVAYVLIAALVLYQGSLPTGAVIAAFLVIFGLTRVTAGSAMVGRFDVVGKVVPRSRLAAFYATRGVWTSAGGLAAGVFISAILASRISFPWNYALLFLASSLVFTAGALIFGLIREPRGPAAPGSQSPLSNLGRAFSVVRRDPRYRRYLVYRLMLEVMGVAAPFYMVYAIDAWDVPAAMSGTYVAAGTAAGLVANFFWQRRAHRHGNVSVLTLSVLLGSLAPVLPLALALTLHPGASGWVPSVVFLLLFMVQGAGNSGREICNNAILMNLAPESDRPSYLGLTNTLTGLATFVSIPAGRMIDLCGYLPLFAIAVLASLATWWAASRVSEMEATCDRPPAAGDDA